MSVTIVTATGTEANAVRGAAPGVRIVEVGMGLSRYDGERFDTAIVCGVAGGLRYDAPTGTIVIASEVGCIDGSTIAVDGELRNRLANAARDLGHHPLVAPMLYSPALVTGKQRSQWAEHGFAAVDMESGGINVRRLAVVRVILDTPQHEISPEWQHPARAMLKPSLWGELFWLARHAPRSARTAASIVAYAQNNG